MHCLWTIPNHVHEDFLENQTIFGSFFKLFQTISDRIWKSIWDRFWKISNLTVFGPFCWRRRCRDHHFRPCCCHRRWGKQGISVASPNLSVARLSLPSIFAAAWTTPTTKKMMMMTTTTNMAIHKSHPSDVICSAHAYAHALFFCSAPNFFQNVHRRPPPKTGRQNSACS